MQNSKKSPASASPSAKQKTARKAPAAKKAAPNAPLVSASGDKPSDPRLELKASQGAVTDSIKAQPAPKATSGTKAGKSDAKSAKSKKKPAAKTDAIAVKANKDKTKADKEKPKKEKLVRDSFTMPANEYQMIGDIKKACISAGFAIKKSEVLRIGVALLKQMPASNIQAALAALPALKAGRPKKESVL